MAISRRNAIKSLSAAAAAPLLDPRSVLQAEVLDPATLAAIAEVVLPSESDRKASVTAFTTWLANYKEGADTDHGYGNTRVRSTGPSPARNYPAQIAALDAAAKAKGAAGFAAASLDQRGAIVEAAIADAKIDRLSARPTGAHIAADLMGHYFNSATAQDLCYRAAIGRDACRGLPGSEKKPAPLPPKKVFRLEAEATGSGATRRVMATHEADVVIIGGGISAAMLAEKLSELKPGLAITVVEAGQKVFDFENRAKYRQRSLDYGENAWPADFIEDQAGAGVISRTMAVGGSALHWGGVTNRFSEEDLTLKSRYGLATDWPLSWTDLERHYCEAERRLGVSGQPGPLPEDKRSEPFPMPPMPLSYNLLVLKAWAEKSGIPFESPPQAKNTRPYGGRAQCLRCNTCEICPTGARYSPDFTFKQLLAARRVTLHDQTLVRRIVASPDGKRIVSAKALSRANGEETEYRAKTFVLASGYAWSPHLLLLSGVANSSGLVGKYMTGHAFIGGQIELDATLYPGMNEQHSLISRKFFRCAPATPFVRHDLRVWESSAGRDPRLKDAAGKLLMGDALLEDWRARTARGAARVRAYYDVHPSADSALTLDASRKNRFGDPLPQIRHALDEATKSRATATREHILGVFNQLAKANNGRVFNVSEGSYLDHPAGGCRMGTDPATSVCDSFGRTHDHENLFVVGSPTLPTGGCTNATLTFVALTLRSAMRIANP